MYIKYFGPTLRLDLEWESQELDQKVDLNILTLEYFFLFCLNRFILERS